MVKVYGLIVVLLCSLVSQGQTSKEERQRLEEAKEAIAAEDYLSSWNLLIGVARIHQNDPEINYLMGISGFKLNQFRAESHAYLKSSAHAEYQKAYLPLARSLLVRGEPQEALRQLEKCEPSKEVELLRSHCENAIIAFQDEIPVSIESVGDGVNSDYLEHTPLISFNDSVLFFTSRRPIDDKAVTDLKGEYDENIYYSKRQGINWTESQPLPGNVNGSLHESAVSLVSTENLLVFKTSHNLESSDLWLVTQKEGEWKFENKLDEPINSKWIENSACSNVQGNVYYVSSNRPGGYGGFDLYRVVVFGNGKLSEPQNLGAIVNSEYDEVAPFLLPDDRTLYFSSNRPESMGGLDIFKTINLSDQQWAKPANLGYPLNSTADDAHISVSWQGGGVGYFTREKQTAPGDFDIFRTNLPGFDMTANVFRFKIDNYDPVVGAKVRLIDSNYEPLGFYTPNAEGEFIAVLLPGESGTLEVLSKGKEPFKKPLEYETTDEIRITNIILVLKNK